MKKNNILTALFIGGAVMSAPLLGGALPFKMYEVRSGKITYTISGDNKMMKVRGKERRIFDRYGYRELIERVEVQTMDFMGQKQKSKTHTLNLRVGNRVTHADFERKTLTKVPAIGLDMILASGQKNLTKLGEKMLRQMGGRKIGTEKVAGYTCDVWKLPVGSQCLYHGVPLKIVTDVMGMRRTEVATEAAFDIAIPESSYKLPAFKQEALPPEVAGMFGGDTAAPQGGGADLGALLQQAAQQAPAQGGQEQADGLQGLGAVLGGAALSEMKREIAEQAKALKASRTCIAHARTLRAANRCVDEAAAMAGEDRRNAEHFDHWDAATRDKTLREIDEAQKHMACIQRAQTLQQMQQCE